MTASTDGLRFFYKNRTDNLLYVRSVTNAWDFAASDREYTVNLNSAVMADVTFGSFTFSHDGVYAIFCGYVTSDGRGCLVRVRMSEPWDVTTASVLETAYPFGSGGYLFGVAVNEEENVLFLYKSQSTLGDASGMFYSYQLGDKEVPSPFATERYADQAVSAAVAPLADTNWVRQAVSAAVDTYKPMTMWAAGSLYVHNATGELFKCDIIDSKWTTGTTVYGFRGASGDPDTQTLRYNWGDSWRYIEYNPYTGLVRQNASDIYGNHWSTWGYQAAGLDPTVAGTVLTNMVGTDQYGNHQQWHFTAKTETPEGTPYDRFATTGEVARVVSAAFGGALSGEVYDFPEDSDLAKAVADIVRVLGGSVTNSAAAAEEVE